MAENTPKRSSLDDGHIPKASAVMKFMTKGVGGACVIIWLVLAVGLSLTAISFSTLALSGDQGNADPLDERSINFDMDVGAQAWGGDQLAELFETESDDSDVVALTQPGNFFFFLYIAKDGDVFSKDNVKEVRALEQMFDKDDDYNKFCLQVDGLCTTASVNSVTNYFYATPNGTEPCNDPDEGWCYDGSAKEMRDYVVVKEEVKEKSEGDTAFFVDKNYKKTGKSEYSRGLKIFGAPLKGYLAASDRSDEQAYKFAVWLLPFDAKLQDHNADETNNIEVIYFSPALIEQVFLEILARDGSLAGASCFFIFGYMVFHTRSALLALLGTGHILMSFPIGYAIYFWVFGIKEFLGMNFLGIYVVLAIGADDIFVFVDAWKQSYRSLVAAEPLAVRMQWVWDRAAKAMFVTSFTTAAAFFATAISPLPAVSAFGIFSACLVIFNYLFVITYFPAAVIFYHFVAEGKYRTCLCCCAKTQHGPAFVENLRNKSGATDGKGGAEGVPLKKVGVDVAKKTPAAMPSQPGDEDGEDVNKRSCVDKFFLETYYNFLSTKRNAAGILMLFLAFSGVMVYFAVQLEPATSAEQFLPASHPLQRFITLNSEAFVENAEDSMVQVNMIWGADSLDKTGLGKFDLDPSLRGEVQWSEEFNLFALQEHLANFCDEAAADEYLTRKGEVSCALQDFRTWIRSNSSHLYRWLAVPSVNLPQKYGSFPIEDEKQFNFLLGTWFFFGGPADNPIKNYRDFNGQLGFKGKLTFPNMTKAIPVYFAVRMGYGAFVASNITEVKEEVEKIQEDDALQVQYFIAVANTTLPDTYVPSAVVKPHYEAWEAFKVRSNNIADVFKLEGAHMEQSSDKWIFMHTQEVYVSSALSGGAISLGLAFIVLVISTGNVVVSLFATSSLCFTVASLLGLMVLLGWSLGTVESLCATVLVGLSIDYVVHLANAYIESHSETREDRTFDMLENMAATVLGGAFTSVGASLILFGCQIQFFFKFGAFMCITCALSLMFSLGYFVCLSILFGPCGNTGQFLWKKKVHPLP